MYPVLILREELVCLVVLVFLMVMSRKYTMGKDGRIFLRLMIPALCHVVMDIVTVWTVNHPDQLSVGLNDFFHAIFYISAILYSNEIFNYVLRLVNPAKQKKAYRFTFIPPVVYLLCLPWIPIEYVEVQGTRSSSGPAAFVGYGIAFVYFFIAIFLTFRFRKKLSRNVTIALLPMMAVLIICESLQIIFRELLFTGGAITIVTLGFFFSLENPAQVFERKAMTDALTGVRSRHSFDVFMEEHNALFKARPSTDYIFVYCDVNDLRAVNNSFGHAEGDEYITTVAVLLLSNLSHAENIYRMGGDEFLAIYRHVDPAIVEKELSKVVQACDAASDEKEYPVVVAVGYAVSGPQYHDLDEVIRTADYMMYRNKEKIKENRS